MRAQPGDDHEYAGAVQTGAVQTGAVQTGEAELTSLPGVGPALAEKLQRLGIVNVSDLLFHLPIRYEDRTRIRPLGEAMQQQAAVFQGIVQSAQVQFGRRRSLLVRLRDATGELGLRFYYFNQRQQAAFQPGRAAQVFGEPRRGASGLEIYHPEYSLAETMDALPGPEGTLTPVYPITEGLAQKRMQGLVRQALDWLQEGGELRDFLPDNLLKPANLPDLRQALTFVHAPAPGTEPRELTDGSHPGIARLALEELLAQHLGLQRVRQAHRQDPAPPLDRDSPRQQHLRSTLPFQLTAAQNRVLLEIESDLSKPTPMLRLVQGDVGSGKTLVAVMALLKAADNGWQSAFMAPTEILAEQHARNLSTWLAPLDIEPVLLLGKQTRRQRADALARIREGALCVVGTHALFQNEVEFRALGLLVVDEQHRFGVDQRLALREKGRANGLAPHQMIMTATPIPRTLAMSVYADLDLSVIDELPPGRQPVTTTVTSDVQRDQVVNRIREACAEGRQTYWVCTLIEENEELQAQAAEELYEQLGEALAPAAVGLVHGRMKPADKAAVMAGFVDGSIRVLVATTVIEVGVDVPNASVMIIENAERLGLSQLHQLRGRVGRGAAASYCVLLYHAPLSRQGKARLQTMRSTSDGFRIAEQDLMLRGPGEVLGIRQTGLAALRVADLQRDQKWLPTVRTLGEQMIRHYPDRVDAILRRWHPSGLDYGNV